MKRYRQSDRTLPAFTLVEVVTAIAIIAILAAILVPAFSLAMRTAMNVKQKGQFNSINIALEGYRTDFGDYPESYSPTDIPNQYGGAQRLAEAVVGYDGLGFHPRSVFSMWGTSDGVVPHGGANDNRIYLYANIAADAREASIKQRKGPYLETETANAAKMADIYGTAVASPINNTFVLTDAFGTVKNKRTNKQIGMPILYYKANPAASRHDPAHYDINLYSDLNIFDLRHNQSIIDLGRPMEGATALFPPLSQYSLQPDPTVFYEMTRNPNYYNTQDTKDTTFWRPYRAESFILHSAGYDGLYGTPDDVFNFDPGK